MTPRHADRVFDLHGIETEQPAHRCRCADRADGGGRVPTELDLLRGDQPTDLRARFEAGNVADDKVLTAATFGFRDGEKRWHQRNAWMAPHPKGGVVVLFPMRDGPVQECCRLRAHPIRLTNDGRASFGVLAL